MFISILLLILSSVLFFSYNIITLYTRVGKVFFRKHNCLAFLIFIILGIFWAVCCFYLIDLYYIDCY